MERLALDRFSSPWLRNQHLVRYLWASTFARGARVLDAACGTGYGSRILKESGAAQVTSLDVSPEAAEAASRRGDLPFLRFLQGDVARLPLKDGSFDLHVCFETVEHVQEDEALLAEARRVLAPGGTFLCSTPNRDLLSPGLTIEHRPLNPHHVREYSIVEFENLLRRFFSEVELFAQTWFSEAHRKLLLRAGERSNRLAVKLHQLSNVARLPWERPERHFPRPFQPGGAPEVVIGVCRVSSRSGRSR